MSNYLPTVFGENLMDVFDDFDRNFFRGFGNIDRTLYGKHAQNMMKTDVKETDEGYEVDVDLPGFKKDEIQLELNNGYLTISAEKSLEKDEENKKGKMLRQERYAGVMQRSFYVGEHITEEDIKASYESGVLHLMYPEEGCAEGPTRRRPFRSRAKPKPRRAIPAGCSFAFLQHCHAEVGRVLSPTALVLSFTDAKLVNRKPLGKQSGLALPKSKSRLR